MFHNSRSVSMNFLST